MLLTAFDRLVGAVSTVVVMVTDEALGDAGLVATPEGAVITRVVGRCVRQTHTLWATRGNQRGTSKRKQTFFFHTHPPLTPPPERGKNKRKTPFTVLLLFEACAEAV